MAVTFFWLRVSVKDFICLYIFALKIRKYVNFILVYILGPAMVSIVGFTHVRAESRSPELPY